ncbi:tetratricopeptide repeat protein [Euhalothece natronophila Z-M001]|uniref:Tetratricopeptide repeat protein n=1 Tax=Euhalothece natronophila Z-M001 TaxID=522448 RepID=A0A5B8NJH7_9CHRO|nr:tetratricopeptide repeat protein [Euhalothece natronophila]QDZ39144.1 tetratricopeptide repeat protein [Euhalothece natronophila Z-M001]
MLNLNVIKGIARKEIGDIEGAIADFNEAIRSQPDDDFAYLQRGLIRKDQLNFDDAIADYTEAIRLNPDYTEAYYERGLARIGQGNLEGAIADFTEAVGLNSDYTEAYYERGLVYLEKMNLESAIADFTEVVRVNSDYAEAYYNRGKTYWQQGNLESAIADFTEVVRVNPDYTEAYYSRGKTYWKQGNLKEAIADFTKVIRVKPDYTDAYNDRGLVYLEKGDSDSAIADFNEAIRLNPDDPQAYYNRGNVRSNQADLDSAIADLNEAIRLNPDDSEVYKQRAIFYYNQGYLESAIADLNEAIRLNPDDPQAYKKRGFAYYNKGNFKGAIADLSKQVVLIIITSFFWVVEKLSPKSLLAANQSFPKLKPVKFPINETQIWKLLFSLSRFKFARYLALKAMNYDFIRNWVIKRAQSEISGQVSEIWNWSSAQLGNFFEGAIDSKEDQNKNHFKGLDKGTKLENILWNDPDYQNGIKQSAIVSHEDYPFAKDALENTEFKLKELEEKLTQTLTDIKNQINQQAKAETAQEVIDRLDETTQALKEEIKTKLKAVQDSLEEKKRNLDSFTIAFIGRTKAGKSTLHSILTEQGWSEIGDGEQRTTRQNRFYEWNNIRIIDTPGIGAPGGKTDEETAQSIINEADLVVFVVTNDSQQESEFQFLKLLKENAKPLCILLNLRKNLNDSRRGQYELKRLLENPNRVFDNKEMQGHFNRIRGYTEKYYGNDYFSIIPVMLLAAQLSYEDKHEHQKEELWEASRIENFLEQIRLSIVEQAGIRRSQNLLGSTVKVIEEANIWTKEQATSYQTLAETIKNKQETLQQDIDKAIEETEKNLESIINELFAEIRKIVPEFADQHWNDSADELEKAWKVKLNYLNFEKKLNDSLEEESNHFTNKVQQLLEELGKDLQFTAKSGGIKGFKLNDQNPYHLKEAPGLAGGLFGIAGAIAFLVPGGFIPGIVMEVVGAVIGLIAKPKAEIKKEAINKITKSLRQQIDQKEKELTNQVTAAFQRHCNPVKREINTYLDQLISGLTTISEELQTTEYNLEEQVNFLNCAYGKRIIDWSQNHYEPLTQEAINHEIVSVNREIGKRITIKAKNQLTITRSQEELDSILQEKVILQISDIPKKRASKRRKQMNTYHHYDSKFEVNEISQRFHTHLNQFKQILSSQEEEQLKEIQNQLSQELDHYYQHGILTIAFIGQYSAGKSTIISALTGKRDIYIDADIATDTTALYDWNGIKIIDTPGLYTERTEHDQITYDAIEKADLLVFCLTNNLFDQITADNFKKLAYDKEYAGKMMLVVNKMSQEAGEQQELIENYKKTLAKTLEPYPLENFSLSFIDAKDYCDGIDEEDDLLIELSGFSEFLQSLNQFIEEKRIMARLDTPVRITLSKLNDAELAVQRDENEEDDYLELVNRCARRVEEERKRFRTEVKTIALELNSKVRKEATPLVDKIGTIESQEEANKLSNQADENIQQHCDSAQKSLENVANKAQVSLRDSLQELLDAEFTQVLIERLEKQTNVSPDGLHRSEGREEQLNELLKLGEFVSNNLYQSAQNFIPLVGKDGFLSSWNVIGSPLHKGVYEVGKFLGVNFKPFQAVNIAKNLGNAGKVAGKVLGPAMVIVTAAMEVKNFQEEKQKSEELSEDYKQINSQFTELAQQFQTQLESIAQEVEKQIYDETAEKIEQMREAHNQNINQNQEQVQQLAKLRQEFKQILSEISSY